MLGFQEYLEEKLITFGGKAYPPFNTVLLIGGGAGCFEKGTLVRMEEGYKPIEEVKVGDMVWTFNQVTDVEELKQVLRTPFYEEHEEDLLEITFEDGTVVRCTENHPFYVDGEWVLASELNQNKTSLGKAANVYDLTVEGNSNYFVTESNILVHNSGKGFTLSNLIGLDSMTFDVDHLKSLSLKSLEVQKAAKDKFGVDISKFQLKNPDDVAALHDILSDKLGIIDKHQATRFKSIMLAAPDRKPNLIFDVTLKDLWKLDKISKQVQQLGYSVDNIHIVWVVNDFRVALQQNRERDRMVPEDILLDTHVGAGMTMKSLIDGTYDLKKYANGDFYISFNKRGVDSSLVSSGRGGSYVKDSNYLKIKSKGKPITPLKDLSKEVVKKIAAYVPSLANWEDAAK
jgi:hypothetical protein